MKHYATSILLEYGFGKFSHLAMIIKANSPEEGLGIAHREASKFKKKEKATRYSVAFDHQSLEDGFVFTAGTDIKVNLIKEET